MIINNLINLFFRIFFFLRLEERDAKHFMSTHLLSSEAQSVPKIGWRLNHFWVAIGTDVHVVQPGCYFQKIVANKYQISK